MKSKLAENYPREAYLTHPLRDPDHRYGNPRRFVLTLLGRKYYLPRNPGRWRPGNPTFGETLIVETRQQRRWRERKGC